MSDPLENVERVAVGMARTREHLRGLNLPPGLYEAVGTTVANEPTHFAVYRQQLEDYKRALTAMAHKDFISD